MIQVGMRDEYMIDFQQIIQRKRADSGASIDQNILVQQHCGGMRITPYSTATAQYF